MASILQAAGLSKSYGIRTLFENLYININEGDKIALSLQTEAARVLF